MKNKIKEFKLIKWPKGKKIMITFGKAVKFCIIAGVGVWLTDILASSILSIILGFLD